MMKKIVFLASLLGMFVACKKGANDPDFSLRSRKARLSGEWELKTASITHDDTTFVFDGTNMIITYDTISVDTVGFTQTYTFDGDGNYNKTTVREFSGGFFVNGEEPFTTTEKIDGLWNFTGGAGETKTKSQLQLTASRYDLNSTNEQSRVLAENYIGNPQATVYDIDRLAQDELTLTVNFIYEFPGGKDSRVEEWNFEKK